jgi:hypothetical protein
MPTPNDIERDAAEAPRDAAGRKQPPGSHRTDPHSPPLSKPAVKVDRDPLPSGSVRPNPSGTLP